MKTEIQLPGIQMVRFEPDNIIVELSDARIVWAPLAWYPRLLYSTPTERLNWRLIGNGEGVHWPDIDEDISVENILLGKPSGESQDSFKKWLSQKKGR